jgi:predicted PurR-regulated permease PerM
MEDDANRNMIMAGVFIALTIGMAAWQVLRTLSRGGLDGVGAVRLVCSLFVLGIMLYVGYTALSLWT